MKWFTRPLVPSNATAPVSCESVGLGKVSVAVQYGCGSEPPGCVCAVVAADRGECMRSYLLIALFLMCSQACSSSAAESAAEERGAEEASGGETPAPATEAPGGDVPEEDEGGAPVSAEY